MQDNPLHIRVFAGVDAQRDAALSLMFAQLLRQQKPEGVRLGVYDPNELVGVAARVRPGCCQPKLSEQAAMLPALLCARLDNVL